MEPQSQQRSWARFEGLPLQVHTTPKVRERIEKIAANEHISKASVVRDLIDAGLDERERQSNERSNNHG